MQSRDSENAQIFRLRETYTHVEYTMYKIIATCWADVTRVMRASIKAGEGVPLLFKIDKLMSSSSLEGKAFFKKLQNSELLGFLIQVLWLSSSKLCFLSLLTKIHLRIALDFKVFEPR